MADERRTKLDAVIKRRDTVREALQRAKGRKDAAEKELADLVEECRVKNIVPDQLDSVIAKLNDRCDKEIQVYDAKVAKAEESIKPYVEGT